MVDDRAGRIVGDREVVLWCLRVQGLMVEELKAEEVREDVRGAAREEMGVRRVEVEVEFWELEGVRDAVEAEGVTVDFALEEVRAAPAVEVSAREVLATEDEDEDEDGDSALLEMAATELLATEDAEAALTTLDVVFAGLADDEACTELELAFVKLALADEDVCTMLTAVVTAALPALGEAGDQNTAGV